MVFYRRPRRRRTRLRRRCAVRNYAGKRTGVQICPTVERQAGDPHILFTDCDHLHRITGAMLKRMPALKDREIVMVTHMPLASVKTFYDQYKLAGYPNIKVGTEGFTFIVRNYYQVQQFPFIVEYDRQGKFVKTITDQSLKPEVMAAQL